ncbi:MAG: Crp/Fnr family transcriptional regulator [Flavobacteriaceae bacterium]|nr:Crp/Fnr family transcriptional regulator [Flavobacteriaceae bacterium]
MENILVEMMSNFIDLTEDEKQGILDAFPIRTYKKGTDLLKEGQIAKDAFLVIKGCARKYSIENGEEKSTEFYTEFQSAVNFDSMSNSSPSKYYFTCTEDSTIAIINSEKENALYKKFPRFGEICRVEMEKMLGASQEKLSTFINSTPKERYLNLLKDRPDLINRVPQHQLASYLGIKPETLSRIRRRISLKE